MFLGIKVRGKKEDNYMTNYSEYLFIKRYHKQMMRILWRMYKHLTTKLSIPDVYDLETEITELEKIYEMYCVSS